MSFHFLGLYWQKRIVRVAVGMLALVGALILQYYLTNVPLPVDVGTPGKYFPATLRLGQEELIIEGPAVNPSEGVLLSHVGNPNEVVDVYFERARLSEETINLFKDLGLNSPAAPGQIDYLTQDEEKRSDGGEACRPFMRVELEAASTLLTEVRFFQLDTPGFDRYRHLEMRTSGGELAVRMATEMPPDGTPQSPGCRKLLKVGDWDQPMSGSLGITAMVTADSSFRFRFKSAAANTSLWGGSSGLFEPFQLGSPKLKTNDPPPFQARAVSIKSFAGDGSSASSSILSARSTDAGPLLSVNALRVGSDQLQISVSGRGWVKVNGEDVTVDLYDRMKRYPIPAGLLAAANAALVTWFTRLLFGQRQAPAPEPASSPSKSRRKRRKGKETRTAVSN